MANNGHAKLIVKGGHTDGTAIPLSGGRVTFGRVPDNDIVLGDIGVSRTHAVVEKTSRGFVLRDLDSTNGTFVNRKDLGRREHLLKDGDDISIASGRISFVFQQASFGDRRNGASRRAALATTVAG